MSEAYADLVVHLVRSGIVASQHLYDFSYKSLEVVYDQFYDFFNEILQEQAKKLGFPPSYLYFVDDEDPNAYASSPGDCKKIGIHYGAIEKLYEFFERQEDLLKTAPFNNVRDLLSSTGNPVYYAFTQYFYTFLFYHEYAHLIQRSPIESFTHIEYDKTGSDFNTHFDEIAAHISLVLEKMKTMPFLCYNRPNETLP